MDTIRLLELEDTARLAVISNARLIDGLGGPPVEQGYVALRGGKILSAGPTREAPASDLRIDAHGLTLLPGLIDAHAHLVYAGFRSLEAIDRCSIETATINAVLNAERLLRAGYTAIRDVGTIANVAASFRDAIAEGKVPGPTVVASGQILCATASTGDTLPSHWRSTHGLGKLVDGPD